MTRIHKVGGEWIGGAHAGVTARVEDVRVGKVYTVDPAGLRLAGSAEEFRAVSGESGDLLLSLVLRTPTARSLFAGANRDGLAAIHCLAKVGRQETRGWDTPARYIVDSGAGGLAIVQFIDSECVGIATNHERDSISGGGLTASTDTLAERFRDQLLLLSELPLVKSFSGLRTAFWTQDGMIAGAAPWPRLYTDGVDVLRLELCSDEEWIAEAAAYYGLDQQTATMIVSIASRRRSPQDVMAITKDEESLLLPSDVLHREEARKELVGSNVVFLEK